MMATDYRHNNESHLVQMRDHARTIFSNGVEAADPRTAVVRTLHAELSSSQDRIVSKSHSSQLQEFFQRKVRIVAVGKAAITMAEGALECIPGHLLIEAPVVVTS